MRKRATFLGVLTIVAALATAIGAAMVLRSNDTGDDSAMSAYPAAATGVPGYPQTGGLSELQGGTDRVTPAPANAPSIQAYGGSADSGGVGDVGGAGSTSIGSAAGSNSIVDRKIERNSTLAITVDNVIDAVNRIQAAATGAGGYVSQQNITETAGPPDEDGKPTKQQLATVQIRVPSESYEGVMTGLRGIASDVTSENTQTTEVTAQYTDLQSQLRNLEATEKQYLALLDRAETISDILTVSDRLSGVRLQIEQIQGQINLLDNLTSMATITINVSLPPVIAEVVTEPAEENFAVRAINNAWEASQDVLEFLAVAAITAGVVMIWILVPGVLALVGWRLFGRRSHGATAP